MFTVLATIVLPGIAILAFAAFGAKNAPKLDTTRALEDIEQMRIVARSHRIEAGATVVPERERATLSGS